MYHKLFAAVLALLLLCTPALAQQACPLGDFLIAPPADAAVETGDNVLTLVRGAARLVAQVIPQEMEEDPQAQVEALLKVYDENVGDISPVRMIPGVYAAAGVIPDSFGPGLAQLPLLALTDSGLLILSAYHLEGDQAAAEALLQETLAGVTLGGEALTIRQKN